MALFLIQQMVLKTIYFSQLSFAGILDRGSEMSQIEDPGSGINIPDPPPYSITQFVGIERKHMLILR